MAQVPLFQKPCANSNFSSTFDYFISVFSTIIESQYPAFFCGIAKKLHNTSPGNRLWTRWSKKNSRCWELSRTSTQRFLRKSKQPFRKGDLRLWLRKSWSKRPTSALWNSIFCQQRPYSRGDSFPFNPAQTISTRLDTSFMSAIFCSWVSRCWGRVLRSIQSLIQECTSVLRRCTWTRRVSSCTWREWS